MPYLEFQFLLDKCFRIAFSFLDFLDLFYHLHCKKLRKIVNCDLHLYVGRWRLFRFFTFLLMSVVGGISKLVLVMKSTIMDNYGNFFNFEIASLLLLFHKF